MICDDALPRRKGAASLRAIGVGTDGVGGPNMRLSQSAPLLGGAPPSPVSMSIANSPIRGAGPGPPSPGKLNIASSKDRGAALGQGAASGADLGSLASTQSDQSGDRGYDHFPIIADDGGGDVICAVQYARVTIVFYFAVFVCMKVATTEGPRRERQRSAHVRQNEEEATRNGRSSDGECLFFVLPFFTTTTTTTTAAHFICVWSSSSSSSSLFVHFFSTFANLLFHSWNTVAVGRRSAFRPS